MAAEPQNFKNHVRFNPPLHFVLLPIFLINVIIAIVSLALHPGWLHVWVLIMSFALILFVILMRMHSLKVQDRVIRLEERLRLAAILPEAMRPRIPEFTEEQLIGLRFASDHELAALAQRTLDEHLKLKQIKQAVTDWRADYWRV